MLACLATCRAEAIDSEQALLHGECHKLRTATGFVFGGVLASAIWSAIGLLTWCMIA